MTRKRKAGHYTGPKPNCARIVARIFLWIKATVITATLWRGDLAGWYVLHSDGIPSGVFGCWRLGLTESWRADLGRELIEREQQRQRSEQAKQKREQADRELRAAARSRAGTERWVAAPATGGHPYLRRKRIAPYGLRVDTDGRLIVPVRDRKGDVQSLQFITGDGVNRFLPGGHVAGNYYAIGSPGATLCVAEGFATAGDDPRSNRAGGSSRVQRGKSRSGGTHPAR